jgi:hypothetical protein
LLTVPLSTLNCPEFFVYLPLSLGGSSIRLNLSIEIFSTGGLLVCQQLFRAMQVTFDRFASVLPKLRSKEFNRVEVVTSRNEVAAIR